jgi:GNAT superfamily N-acetyltransferase
MTEPYNQLGEISRRDPFIISTDPTKADHDVIAGFLATSYWAGTVPRDRIIKSLDGSFTYHLIDEPTDAQIGFARVVSDGARFAYLCDVFVLDSYRGRGLGAWLIETAMADARLESVGRWVLATADAQPFYRKLGFEDAKPGRYMIRDL